MTKTIAVSVNSSWNLINFRAELLRRLISDGFRVVALTPQDAHADALRALGVEHFPLAIDSQGVSPLGDARLAWRYWRALRRIRPAAYLGWTIKPNTYGSLAAQALGIPVVNNVSGLGTAFIRRGWLTRVASILYRLAFARSATVFFQNSTDRDLFVARGLVSEARTALLPGSGIDTARFAPVEEAGRAEAPFTFLMIARLIRDKGAFEYVEAATRLRTDHPDVRFDILGQLDVANRTAIPRAQLDRWVADGVVCYRGEADDVRPFIAEADCVVLPSYREGMPRSLLEAAAMGKPLIATAVPGCMDIARSGENALLCAPRDAASLAQALETMLQLDAATRLAMGRRSRDIATAEFDTALVQAKYVDAIQRALMARPPRSTVDLAS